MKLLVINDIFDKPSGADCISTLLPHSGNAEHLSLNRLSNTPHLTGEALHQHLFEQGGIETIVQNLLAYSDPDTLCIGYSAAGTALWRAVQAGMLMKGLFCISSTRLRELGPIFTETYAYFGSLDAANPNEKWLADIPANHMIFKNIGHSFYTETSLPTRNARQMIAKDIAQFHARCQRR